MAEPITLADTKLYIRVTSADEDAKITAMIPRARKWVEDHTGLVLERRQFVEQRLPDRHGAVRLYKGPLVSVDSIAYVDSDGAAQTYVPLAYPPSTRIVAANDDYWPTLSNDRLFTITYTAGYATAAEIDERLIGAMLALIEGEYSEGFAYPDRAVEAAERCCSYLRAVAV